VENFMEEKILTFILQQRNIAVEKYRHQQKTDELAREKKKITGTFFSP
jgi:hypothetical protein